MSLYESDDLKKLLSKCDNSNKKIILDTLKSINEENVNDIELIKIEKINNIFFKNSYADINTYNTCGLCDNKIKSKEHKIKLNICEHVFHKKCLNKHLKKCLTNFMCPICHTNYKSQLESIAFTIINTK